MARVYKGDILNKQLSPHFNLSEFRCKCGKNHDTLLDDALWKKLEELYAKLNCSKIIISSGYRCIAHDIAVGGAGGGYHTKGMAADCCCYDKKGNPINTKIVSCVAQDLGFGGMANINSSYTYIHLDVRTGGRWFGNETLGYGSLYKNGKIVTDFYDYYGLTRDYVNDFCHQYDDEKPVNTEKPVEPEKPIEVDPNVNPYTEPKELISEKSSGDSVKWLQWYLTKYNFYNGTISGNFDLVTYGALLAFQFKNKLTVDGLCGNNTKKALKNYNK